MSATRPGAGGGAARFVYATLMRVVAPLYALRVLWRGRSEPVYAQHVGERFGLYSGAAEPGAVWVHAVSLGETRAAAPLLAALRTARPGVRLLLTHGTATGRTAGAALLQAGDAQAWLPFDTPGGGRRFLRHFRPTVGVLVETEVWPNVLAEARDAGLPMFLANARLSVRSRRRGARVDAVLRPAFASFAAAFAQSEGDGERLCQAGVERVVVTGNLKYDMAPEPALLARGRRWKAVVAKRGVVLAASTREGEEAMLLAAWQASPAPRPLLVVVPRHPQRFDAVAAQIAAAGFGISRRSMWVDDTPPAAAASTDVWLGDSMLEMPAWYALADAALLGGSYAPLGGQNLIEAAACGCPVVMGPHTFNFAEAAELSLQAGAAIRVADMKGGVAEAVALCGNAADRETRSSRALGLLSAHRGAAERMTAQIAAALPASPGR